jgi:hypothetical protein
MFRQLSILLFAAFFGITAFAADTQKWSQLKQQTVGYLSTGQHAKAEASARALVNAAEELGPLPQNLSLVDTSLTLLANALESQQRYSEELATRLRSLGLLEKYYGKESK